CFSWLVSSIAPIRMPRRRPARQAASSSPATANRRTTPIAANVSQTRAAEQPLGPQRRPVPHPLRDRPPVPLGQVTGQRPDVLARLQPRLRPHKTRPQQRQQLTTFLGRQGGPY